MVPDGLSEESLARSARLLASRDTHLAQILQTHGAPPLWARRPGFATLIRIILEQQVSLLSAAAMFRRLRKNILPFTPRQFLQVGETGLRSLGLTHQKTSYCLRLSESVIDKSIDLTALRQLPDEEVRNALVKIKGIGPWTADVYILMALRRPDVWPENDLALAIAMENLKGLSVRPTPNGLREMAESWRPFRAVAARMLWQHYLAQRGRT